MTPLTLPTPAALAALAGLAALAVVVAAAVPSAHVAAVRARLSEGRRGPAASVDPLAVVERVARDVRSGGALVAATLGATAGSPPGGALHELHRLLVAGTALERATGTVLAVHPADRRQAADEVLVLQTLALCARAGGPVAAPLERAAGVLRERAAWRAERRAYSAQARLSALVMSVLPIAFGAFGVVSSTRVREVLTGSAVGIACAAAGAALNAIGWWWMRRIVDGGRR